MATSGLCNDKSIGPFVTESCTRGTDLTLLLQEIALSSGPGLFIIVLIYVRMVQTSTLRWWPSREATSRLYWMKQVIYIVHFLLASVLMVLRKRAQITATTSHPCAQTGMSFVSDLISTIAASLLIVNTSLEAATTSWSTTPRPFTAYLTFGLLSDLVRARTLGYVCAADRTLGPGFVALGSLKGLAAILELFRRPRDLANYIAEDNSGLFSRLGFAWLYSTIRRGYSTRLQIKDLPATKQGIRIESSGIEETVLEKACSSAPFSSSQYSLHRKILASFSLSIATPIILRLLLLAVQLTQPMIIQATLKFSESTSETNSEHGGFLVLGIMTIYIGAALISGAYWHAVNSDVTRLRGLLFTAIFKRALVTEGAQGDSGNGTMVSLLSSDVDAVLQGFLWIHEIWATPITAAISMWMLHKEVGLAFLSPLVCTFAVAIMSSFLSKHLKSLQQTWLQSTAERSECTLHVLRNMLGIKMSGYSKAISDVVMKYRHVEVEKSKKFRKMLSLLATLANVSTLGITLVTLATFALFSKYTGEELNASKMFTALAILQLPMSSLQTLIASVPLMGATMASLQRIQAYLVQGVEDSASATSADLTHLSDMSGTDALERTWAEVKGEKQPPVFSIEDGTVGWTRSKLLLHNVSFEIRRSEICCIYGQAGTGKSTLLDIMAGRAQGLISVKSIAKDFTRAACCEQTPWLPDDTIQNVIVGAERLDRAWLSRVLSMCCLATDIERLEKGVNTLVGANGAGLSGGQKKRVALARAIYSRNRILILDDPLASLDANSEHMISKTLLGPGGYFKSAKATVILTTSVAKHVHLADRVFEIRGEEFVERPTNSFSAAANRDDQFETVVLDAGGTLEVDKEDAGFHNTAIAAGDGGASVPRATAKFETDPAPKATFEEHKLYIASIGKKNFIVFILLSASIAVASFTRSFELKRISEYHSHDAYKHLGVYISLVSLTLILIFSWNWHFYIRGVGTSSIQLHKVQWEALINSPMSFFSTKDQGEIMNSFTQDLRLVDKELPVALSSASLALFLVMVNVLIAILATIYTAIAIPFLGLAFWLVCRTYLRISYQVRLLDLNSVSPIFNHAIETMQGYHTIHSFGWQDYFYSKFLCLLDESQRPYYTMFAVQQLLQVVLDLFVAVLAIIACSATVAFKNAVDPGILGLTLTSLLTLAGSLKLLVRSFTDLETSIGAIGRINSFVTICKADSEHNRDGCRCQPYDDFPTSEALDEWPRDGSITFEDVTASHGLGKPAVLRNINLKIPHGQRVAVCGRSGSGKTSLALSLFNMINITSGSIVVSDLSTSNLCVDKLRKGIAGVPQDTFFLPGSVRDNFRIYHDRGSQRRRRGSHSSRNSHCDGEQDGWAPEDYLLTSLMVDSLTAVGLYDKVVAAGGLDFPNIGLTTLLSHGERQLFNLARLSVTSSPIIVMDEVTSSMDDETKALARSFMRDRFRGKTIIEVVHRLGSLVEDDWDSYILMDSGKVDEMADLKVEGRGPKFVQLLASGGAETLDADPHR